MPQVTRSAIMALADKLRCVFNTAACPPGLMAEIAVVIENT
jgi:hypothetical protein